MADDFAQFDFGADLDFDLSEFDVVDTLSEIGEAPQAQERILQPRIAKAEAFQRAMYANALEFAKQINLESGARTFAWVSGNFIFGDIIEALVQEHRVGIRKLHIATLSLNQENIDSLENVMLMMGPELERLVLIASGYFYAHYKFDLVPYMYEHLDDGSSRTQIAFGAYHTKIICIQTVFGKTITIHGSANLRSSSSIEQIMVEVDNHDLYQFNAEIMDEIAEKFGTINYKVPKHRLKRIEGRPAWTLAKNGSKKARGVE